MNLSTATKEQLYEIATDDLTPLSYRYEAARELQSRRFDSDMLIDLVRMWPTHTGEEIAEYLGLPLEVVGGIASKYGLKRRESTWTTDAKCPNAARERQQPGHRCRSATTTAN
jgi:hypothetical protein